MKKTERFVYWLEDELDGISGGLTIDQTNRIRDRVKKIADSIRTEAKKEDNNPYSDTRC